MSQASALSLAINSARSGHQACVTTRPSQAKRLLPIVDATENRLILHEVYASIQGEGSRAGLACTFIRTSACNLRCTYCDTRKAFGRGEALTVADVMDKVQKLTPRLVMLTGGEPLLQPGIYPLMKRLLSAGYSVLLETSGSLSTRKVDPRVIIILDLKTPASGECGANDYTNLGLLRPHDEVKFVLGNRRDYEWARQLLLDAELAKRCLLLMGPIWGMLDPRELAAWIVEDGLPVRMQVQIHKYIWGAHVEGV